MYDPPFGIEDGDQRSNRIEDRGKNIALLGQSGFGEFQLGDVESDTVDKPWASVGAADHFGFAMKPDNASVARNHPVGRAQRLAGKEHLGGLDAPTVFVVGMDLLIPADWIFQPFALREPERLLDLRTHVGFADALIEVSHEDHGRDLLHQSAIPGFDVRSGAVGGRGVLPGVLKEYAGQFGENRFRFGRSDDAGHADVSGLRLVFDRQLGSRLSDAWVNRRSAWIALP